MNKNKIIIKTFRIIFSLNESDGSNNFDLPSVSV